MICIGYLKTNVAARSDNYFVVTTSLSACLMNIIYKKNLILLKLGNILPMVSMNLNQVGYVESLWGTTHLKP